MKDYEQDQPRHYQADIERIIAAIRILTILSAAGDKVGARDLKPPALSVKVVRSQLRLQAMDFWVRYADYLANEILNLYEEMGDFTRLDQAEEMLKDDEPDIRRVPMMRYLFGAYEPLSDAIATLRTYDLVQLRAKPRRGKAPQSYSYYLMPLGAAAAAQIDNNEHLRWYTRRAAVVAEVAGKRSGTILKSTQHAIDTYHNTKLRSLIPSIHNEVVSRLHRLRGLALR